MTVRDLIVKLQELDPSVAVYSMGPDCGGYDYTVHAGMELYMSRDGSKVLLGNAEDALWKDRGEDWEV